MEFNAKKMEKCMMWGHDWAIKDCGTYLAKICLCCGVRTFFYAPEEDEENE